MRKEDARLIFLKTAFRDYKVGAWSPSSRYLVRRVLAFVPKELKKVVELGPGEGVMTRAILSHLAPDGELIVIETNAHFAEHLRKIGDARIRVIEGNAMEILAHAKKYEIAHADLMLSSIPFSFIKPKEREGLVQMVRECLKKEGQFIVFHQYWPLAQKTLQKVFGKTVIRYEWKNFLPCFVFVAKK